MKVLYKIAPLLFASMFLFTSCDDDKENTTPDKPEEMKASTQVELHLYQGDKLNKVDLGDTVSLPNGLDFHLTKMRFYLSNMVLTDEEGRETEFRKVYLADFERGETTGFDDTISVRNYEKISFVLGLDPVLNDKNPEDFPQAHPLSTYNQMYWSMLKYRFAIFEGKADTQGNIGGTDDIPVAYHAGTDALYRVYEQSLEADLPSESAGLIINIYLDINTLILGENGNNTIDLMNNNQSHSTTADIDIVTKYMDNWKAATSVEHEVAIPLN